MRRFIICFISIILLYVLQCTLFAGIFSIGGITPNLVLMFTCIVGYMRGRTSGLFTGFFGGMLIDIMRGEIIGFTALLFMLAGFFNGLFHKEYVKEQLVLPISICALCNLLFGIASYVTGFLVRNRLDFFYYLGRVILPEVVYTSVLTIFAYIIVYYINRKLDILGKKRQARNVVKNNS